MPVRATTLAAVLTLLPALSLAQTPPPATSLHGKFQDATTSAAISGVQVKLVNMADTSDAHRASGGDDGAFTISGLAVHSYRLEATRLGYAPLKIVIRVTRSNQDAGVIGLTPESVPIPGITVRESPPPAVVKADTTEYKADAVKISKDATAEDLVQKLPGVTMENGQIKAQGEQVQNVLVNGKPFFGTDPTAAMRNLPADVVDRIQVYDKMSDQAEFSGFDDGNSQKTMNFILRDRRARFGKVFGGGGDKDLYQSGGNATVIHGARRLTLIGMANNINQANFSAQDLFGAMSGIGAGGGAGGPHIMMFGGAAGRRGFGGGGQNIIRMGNFGGGAFDPSSFLVGQQSGLSTTKAGGFNYVDNWGKTLQVSSSVFLNGIDTDNLQTLSRQYLPPQDSIAYYDQNQTNSGKSGNQRFDARLEWTPDSSNSVILQPRLYFQGSDAHSVGDASNNAMDNSALSTAHSLTSETIDGNNLSGHLTLRHRFAKRGRNVSADLNLGHTLRDDSSAQRSVQMFDQGTTTSGDTLDQQSAANTRINSVSTRLAFTEPVNAHLQVQATYSPSFTRSVADARSLGLDPASGAYTIPDSALSNSYLNRNVAQNAGLSALYGFGPWKWLSGVSYQQTHLHSDQSYPFTGTVDKRFGDVLPNMSLNATFANRRNLRLQWRTSTNSPSIGQLQNVVNNSNPLSLTTGNPNLRPTYTHTLSLRLSEADPLHSKSRFVFANVTRTVHTIGSSTFTALTDTTFDGVFLARGTQITAPVNLGTSWNGNLFAVYSRPLSWIKSIVSFNGGGTYSRTPTEINGVTNVGSTYALRGGAVFASNISPNFDFTVSYQGAYNLSRNTRSVSTNGDYYSHTLGVRFAAVTGPGLVVRQELNNNLQSGVPSAYGQNAVLWNTTLGKKFLKNDVGELRVTATDVLQQNRAVDRSVTETYVQDSRDSALGRYVQAVFTYTFK